MPMARAVTVGPVWAGYARMVLSSCSSHLRITLSLSRGSAPLIGHRGPEGAAAAGVVPERAAKVDTTKAATTSNDVPNLCLTRLSLSAVRQTLDGHQPTARLGWRSASDLLTSCARG